MFITLSKHVKVKHPLYISNLVARLLALWVAIVAIPTNTAGQTDVSNIVVITTPFILIVI